MQNSRIWIFLKYLSFVVIIVMAIVLIAQYINLAQLNGKNNNLLNDLNVATNELEQKQQTKTNLENNYNEFVEDQAKENLNMKDENEEVIIGN